MLFNKTILSSVILSTLALTGCGDGEDSTTLKKDTTPAVVSVTSETHENEPESGKQTHQVKVKLNKAALKDGSVDYVISNGTAISGVDYEASSGSLPIAQGDRELLIDVVINGDDIDEDDEYFEVSLSNGVNVTVDDALGRFNIIDSDDTPVINFPFTQSIVAEGSGSYFVPIDVSNASERNISISFEISGLATQSQDYSLVTKSPLEVVNGQTMVELQFDILNDDIPEGGESIIVNLSSALNADLGDEVTTSIIIPGDLAITDTGVTTYFNGTSYTSSTGNADYPDQDALFGLDAYNFAHRDGKSGFSYTKIDSSGNALPSNALAFEKDSGGFRCVRDVHTGLTWETKMTSNVVLPSLVGAALKEHIIDELDSASDNGVPFHYSPAQTHWQSNSFKYYWFNDSKTSNGGGEGSEGPAFPNVKYPIDNLCAFPNQDMANYVGAKHCNTENYVKAMNDLAVCGFTDWRLAEAEELRSIHDYGHTMPSTAVEFFSDSSGGDYISASPSAENEGSAWCVNSTSGEMKLCNKQHPNYIRLVRGDTDD